VDLRSGVVSGVAGILMRTAGVSFGPLGGVSDWMKVGADGLNVMSVGRVCAVVWREGDMSGKHVTCLIWSVHSSDS
jgi:hypothetical protein